MKRKTDNKTRRLRLSKQTVRELKSSDLEPIVGGYKATNSRITCVSC